MAVSRAGECMTPVSCQQVHGAKTWCCSPAWTLEEV